jgi:hypothetical protein
VKSISRNRIFVRLRTYHISIVLLTLCITSTGCSSLSFLYQSPVEIHYNSPDRISFQGKGAGAGIALMSSMGPVGIAIGVAIDEGIAKDIRDTAKVGGVDFKAMLKQAIPSIDSLKDAERIEVTKYGFVIKNGSKDYVAAEVHLTVIEKDDDESGASQNVILSSWVTQQEIERWVTLDDVKTKPELVEMLFNMAINSK